MVSTRPGDCSGLFSHPPPTSTYVLVHWVGYEPTTLRIGTSSLTTWSRPFNGKRFNIRFKEALLGRMVGIKHQYNGMVLLLEVLYELI
jgi:hypothetical protein